MRIIFAGTPDFAASHLQALLHARDDGIDVVCVYTQPDRPAGRGKKLSISPVKALAIDNDIPVEQPVNFKQQDALHTLSSYNADIMVVVAYGIILPRSVLDTPRFGCINVHGSILPRWRGAAPIQRAIWAGDDESGVTIMQMDEGLDTGAILHTEKVNIDQNDTSASLYTKLAEVGPKTLVQSLLNYSTLPHHTQDNAQANYATKLSKEEAKLDWTLDAVQLERNIRAFNPWPCAWFSYRDKPFKVWKGHVMSTLSGTPGQILQFDKTGLIVKCQKDAIVITELQIPNKKRQPIMDIVNGSPNLFTPHEQL